MIVTTSYSSIADIQLPALKPKKSIVKSTLFLDYKDKTCLTNVIQTNVTEKKSVSF